VSLFSLINMVLFKVYGEEAQAKKLARAIVEARYMFKNLSTTFELASLVSSVLDNDMRLDKLSRPTHVATKTFQAIRILVNNEMNELNRGLEIAHELLKPEGLMVVLTFHSLEVIEKNSTSALLKTTFISICVYSFFFNPTGQNSEKAHGWNRFG